MTIQRWALITGCSTGIGRALVTQLRQRGWGVIATARNPETLNDLSPGEDLRCLPLDVTNRESIDAAVKACADLRLTALVNNAGYGQVGPLELLRADELRAQFETNVIAVHAMTNAFLPPIRSKAQPGEGRIVQVASMLGRVSIPLAGPYNASKHAVVALAETLRMELAPEIHVMLVEPGAIQTEFRETITKVWGDLPDRARGTRYEIFLNKYMSIRKDQSQKFAGDVEACATKIAHAMSKRVPPRRVGVGLDSFLGRRLKALLPSAWWERLLRKVYGLA
jgi:NAD(P)-dependent dehydrogenase (short-subunit alcohol dehydrogenase family)